MDAPSIVNQDWGGIMVNADQITDYATHLIKMERLVREMSDLCLVKKYLEACDLTQHMVVETRILSAVLALMHEKEVHL